MDELWVDRAAAGQVNTHTHTHNYKSRTHKEYMMCPLLDTAVLNDGLLDVKVCVCVCVCVGASECVACFV